MNKKLRLLVTSKCNRNCAGCCNKNFDLDALPIVTEFSQYEMVLLTGGEPMLDIERLIYTVHDIKRSNPECLIYAYTAHVQKPYEVLALLNGIDGLTVTLHSPQDIGHFISLAYMINRLDIRGKSLRLNAFTKSGFRPEDYFCSFKKWRVITRIEWAKGCPVPAGEDFKRYV